MMEPGGQLATPDFVLAAIGDDFGPGLDAFEVDVRRISAAPKAFDDALKALKGRGGAVLMGPARLSRAFCGFVIEALSILQRHPEVAFASLGTYRLRPFDHLPFTTLLDGSDGVYLHAAPMFGVVLGPSQVDAALRAGEGGADTFSALLHGGRPGLFPRAPVAVGVPATGYCSQNIDLGKRHWSCVAPAASLARYDRWFELERDVLLDLSLTLAGAVGAQSLIVDLYGVRRLEPGDGYVLTTRGCRNPLLAWGLELQPIEANVTADVPGDVIRLARRSDVQAGSRPFRGYVRRHVGRAIDMPAYLRSLLSGAG